MFAKILITTFWLVFVAELGDKTQIQTMVLTAKYKSILPVLLGSSIALVLSAVIGVLAGSVIEKFIPINYIQVGGGVVFIILGILMVTGKM
jgi:Ca2+/H+ antiporter, TMEM165/GDT1 family